MGKRKLRFHVRKNYERNRPPIKLIVSIPLLSLPQNNSCIANDPLTSSTHLAHGDSELFIECQAQSSSESPNNSRNDPPTSSTHLAYDDSEAFIDCEAQFSSHSHSSSICLESLNDESPVQLTVNIPLSIYTSLSTCDSIQLRARLTGSQLIPDSWTLSQSSFVLTMAHMSILYTITVACNRSWSLSVGIRQIDPSRCNLLISVPLILTCVDHIVNLMKILDQSKICSGNCEPRFLTLLGRHKGLFKNRNG